MTPDFAVMTWTTMLVLASLAFPGLQGSSRASVQLQLRTYRYYSVISLGKGGRHIAHHLL